MEETPIFGKFKNFILYMFGVVLLLAVMYGVFFDSDVLSTKVYEKGDMSKSGGTQTYRNKDSLKRYLEQSDDPYTTNDESNDQPVGFFGTDTMYACNVSSGNCYDLDVDSDGEDIERIYFPKGGWIDIDSSECENEYCYVVDENGNDWELEY
jgi:hypothetical protein